MSIYASYFDIGDEHKTTCARIRRIGRKMYEQDDSKPCTCKAAPIVYQGSHVLPSLQDERGGNIGFAAIPGHITRNGKDSSGIRWHPWLRFHLYTKKGSSLILTKKQVKQLRDSLSQWLEQTDKKRAGSLTNG